MDGIVRARAVMAEVAMARGSVGELQCARAAQVRRAIGRCDREGEKVLAA